MNKITIIGTTLVTIIFSACQINQSVNKDLTTGARSRGNGIDCEEIIMQINDKVENRNTFTFGEEVVLAFSDINGLTSENNKTYPGLSLYVVKNEKDTVLSNPNLLNNIKDGTTLSPLLLKASFVAALPYKNNEQYKVHITIWDKKGDGLFTYELPFKVEESKLLTITPVNIKYSNIYLWNESQKQTVLDKKVSQEDVLILILEGLDGLEKKDGKVYPIFSIDLADNKGNKILSNQNVLSEYEADGVDAENFPKSQLPVTITFTKGNINNPCTLKAVLKDKNSRNTINITAELVIE